MNEEIALLHEEVCKENIIKVVDLHFGDKSKIVDEEVPLQHEVCIEKSQDISYKSDETSGINTNDKFVEEGHDEGKHNEVFKSTHDNVSLDSSTGCWLDFQTMLMDKSFHISFSLFNLESGHKFHNEHTLLKEKYQLLYSWNLGILTPIYGEGLVGDKFPLEQRVFLFYLRNHVREMT